MAGTLVDGNEGRYLIVDGIPRVILPAGADQAQTSDSFGFKWGQEATYASDKMRSTARAWLMRRYGFASVAEMRSYFSGRSRILDAGCGGGFSSSLWMNSTWRSGGAAEWIGVDVSDAIDVCRRSLGGIPGTSFVQADVMALPFPPESFDTVFAEGVFHHTPSTFQALIAATRVLEPAGEILFYVYRRKSPVREFTDDHVRAQVSAMVPQEAWEALRPLTRLGQTLAELGVEIEVPEDVPFLEIRAGRYDVQRLVYWHFAKLFWNDDLSFEENHHVNFDWYHPKYAHRQDRGEIEHWCHVLGLSITHLHTEESGYTVRARKA